MLKREWQIFLTAVMFFSRIPVGKMANYKQEYLNQSTRYFPFIGILIGAFAAGLFYACQLILPIPISVVISTIGTILLTGAFHEDGFADVCDAFGGGYTKEKILVIMKDSRIGTYGTVGLLLMVGSKIMVLSYLSVELIVLALISGHAFSRSLSAAVNYLIPYVAEDKTSKSKPLAESVKSSSFIVSSITGVAALALFYQQPIYLLAAILPIIATIWITRFFIKWIGGYTGDCLGSIQQLSEVLFYLGILIIAYQN